MTDLLAWSLPGGIQVRCTGRGSGTFADPTGVDPEVAARRRQLVDVRWTWLRQVHGDHVVVVERPGDSAGVDADGAVSRSAGAALAVITADCAPVALASAEGVLGVVHAGWRGLANGVISQAVASMRSLGATEVTAVLGPCIHAECYQFGLDDLDVVAGVLGDSVRGYDRHGQPALDIPAGVATALEQCDAHLAADAGICTACSAEHWSWRARQDTGRQVMVAWR